MRLTSVVPDMVNAPPAMRSPLGMTIRQRTSPLNPSASGCHAEPSQRPMRFRVTVALPPVVMAAPPAMRSPLGITAVHEVVLLIPSPSADQPWPSLHAAIRLAGTPATLVNAPLTTMVSELRAMTERSASVGVFPSPVPSPDHKEPSHWAMRRADTPPALAKPAPQT